MTAAFNKHSEDFPKRRTVLA